MKKFPLIAALSAAIAGSLGTAQTWAQDEASLEEVIVTATKRAESLQDIPMAVTVMDEQRLEQMGAVEFFDYAISVPNLSFGHIADGTFTSNGVQIRGIAGFGTTGFYIDEIPIPESMDPRVLDVARVEILRGPQGSLYGARNMGGTIRLITKRADPTETTFKVHGFAGTVSEGSMDWGGDVEFNVPISDTAAFRGSAYYMQDTGVYDYTFDNPFTDTDTPTSLENVDDAKVRGLPAMITWNVTDQFTIEPRFMYQKTNLDWLPFGDFEPDNFDNTRLTFIPEPNEEKWSISSLTMTFENNWGRFLSSTAFFTRDTDEREDFTPGTFIQAINDREQFTQEIRFTSDFDGRLQLTAGGFYSKIDNDTLWPCSIAVGFSDNTGIPFNTAPITGIDDCVFTTDSGSEVEEIAVFGELEFAITETLSITAGGRYFDNTLDTLTDSHGIVVEFGGPENPVNIGQQKETGFNPKFAVEWNASEDWTLYGTAAKGFRIGGTNFPVPADFCAEDLAKLGLTEGPLSFDSDKLWNYEIGSKSTLAEGRMTLNVAAYLIDWTDIQQITRLECGFQFTNNTGTAESKGFEVEISGVIGDNFTYGLGVGYTDAKITDPGEAFGILEGSRLPQVPKWNFSANAEYTFNVGGYEGYIFANYAYVDDSLSVNQTVTSPRVRPSYNILDARIGMYVGNWNISLYAKNLTNEHANLSDNRSLAAEDPRRPRIVTNRPRSIGIDFRWNY
jgi:outer membrane receptor protein involved in Fe transport